MAKKSRTTSGVNYIAGKYWCELIGTLMLVLIGTSAIVLSGFSSPTGALQIGAAFGLAVTAVAYSFGMVSGGHINPAVTIAMWSAGRMRLWPDGILYILYQLIGAAIGTGILVLILQGKGGVGIPTALGQNVMAPGYSVWAVLGVEFVATLIFALVILGATASRGGPAIAGLIIGLTLLALHLAFISVDGLSVNPARSFGPAVWVRGVALEQLWIFFLAPGVAGWLAGWLYKSKWLS